jgi:hypothetical protein
MTAPKRIRKIEREPKRDVLPNNPDQASNFIGLLAPASVLIGWFLQKNGVLIPTEIQYAVASLLFFCISYYVGKPSALSRKNREILKDYLPEAPLDPVQTTELKEKLNKDPIEPFE